MVARACLGTRQQNSKGGVPLHSTQSLPLFFRTLHTHPTHRVGRKLAVDDLVAFRIHGVSPEFTEQMQQLVEKDLSSDEFVSFRIHGVSPEFVKGMSDVVYTKISPDDLVSMRIHGIDAAFVKEVRSHGVKDATIDQLIEMRIHGRYTRTSI
jgi:hypothetical protein